MQRERLQSFFSAWREQRYRFPSGALAERLESFFSSFRSLAQSHGTDLGAPSLGQLESLLNAMRPLLADAASAGALFNVWTAAGLKRDEVRNAGVLASLLDPRLCPETAPAFLLEVLARSGLAAGQRPTLVELCRGYSVVTEDCPLGGSQNRVDISIEGCGFLLFIEVKIDSGETDRQLFRYDEVLRRKAELTGRRPLLIYLSPTPPTKQPFAAGYLTWEDVRVAARLIATNRRGKPQTTSQVILGQFSHHASQF